jgi:hypothetical protein
VSLGTQTHKSCATRTLTVFSGFTFAGIEEEKCLKGPNPAFSIFKTKSLELEEIVERLADHRIGVIDRPTTFSETSVMPLTEREVAFHRYPEVGMRTIILGNVYNLSGKPNHRPVLYGWKGALADG